jgi:hypothetical protein
MTQQLENAIAELRSLPSDVHDWAADALMHIVEIAKQPVHHLSADERAVLDPSKAAVRRGEFATDAEVEAVYAR